MSGAPVGFLHEAAEAVQEPGARSSKPDNKVPQGMMLRRQQVRRSPAKPYNLTQRPDRKRDMLAKSTARLPNAMNAIGISKISFMARHLTCAACPVRGRTLTLYP
jgi:hypothetical protein